MAKNIVEIGKQQQALQKIEPNTSIKLFTDEELPQFTKAFEEASVDSKLNFISNLVGQTSGVQGGRGILKATLKQLGGGSSNYSVAATARLNNFRSTEGRELAASIVTGTHLLKSKQFAMPKDADMRAAFNSYVGQTITGESNNEMYDAFLAVYADTMTARGKAHTSDKDVPDKDVLKTALGFVTGGIYDQVAGFGRTENYMGDKVNSWKVIKPYGMDDDIFKKKINDGYASISKATGIPVGNLDNFLLKQAKNAPNGDIQYDLLNERGNPLIVKNAIWRIRMTGVKK